MSKKLKINDRLSLFFAWSDFYIGGHFDRRRRKLYVFPLPFIGVVYKMPAVPDEAPGADRFNDDELRRFLLGLTTEDEREEIRQWTIAERSAGKMVEIAEDNLIDDYVRGLLTEGETLLVEKVFLIQPDRVQKLRFAELLKNFLQPRRARTGLRTAATAAPNSSGRHSDRGK